MHINSLKQQWRKFVAAVALALSLAMCALAGQINESAAALSTGLDGSTPEARMAYLSSLGWSVAPEERNDQVSLPAEFNGNYTDYLAIQKECGFDLTPYAGQTVTRYSYTITNYPTSEEGVQLDLLVLQNQIIGGDVRSTDLSGFMHSLNYPQT